MTAGALQTLVRSDGVAPGRRFLVAGNGPLNLQVAVELLQCGAKVAGVIEAAPAPWTRPGASLALFRSAPGLAVAGLRHLGTLMRQGSRSHGVRASAGSTATPAPRGSTSSRSVAAARRASSTPISWRSAKVSRPPTTCRACSDAGTKPGRGGLVVARDAHGATSLPDVFVAGEAGRFGGARIALVQGALAGRAAGRRLGRAVAGDDDLLLGQLTRNEAFQRALWSLFRAPQPGLARADDATIVCRCEAVKMGVLQAVIAANDVGDVATLKRLTRAGMGRCQGRYCAPSLSALVGRGGGRERPGFAPQMPLRPIPLVALASEKPEWGGHKRSLLPEWTEAPSDDPARALSADVIVIGAGIAGSCTALFLAREGHDVLVVDRLPPNALASGGNAGSLHAQLLSFDHGRRAEGGGGPAARTLPLQRNSIALWIALERELGGNFEIKVTGGLMVAETDRHLAFLAEKTRIERAQGVDCVVIGAADLRALEPALADGFVGAAFCPAEGKINPLVATQAIVDAAVAKGARLLREAHVRSIARQGTSFAVETTRGRITAPRVVNAAGAFASTVGRMLGVDVPVFGAPLQMAVTEAVAPLVSGSWPTPTATSP